MTSICQNKKWGVILKNKKIKTGVHNHGLNFLVFAATVFLIFTIIQFLPNILRKEIREVEMSGGSLVNSDYSITQTKGISNDNSGYARLIKPTDMPSSFALNETCFGPNYGNIVGEYFRETLLDNKITCKVIKNTHNCYVYTISGEKTPDVVWTVVVGIDGGTNSQSSFVLKEGKYNGK